MMITRERLKQEIDRVQDSYLDVLFHIVQTFEYAPSPYAARPSLTQLSDNSLSEWYVFVETTYGSLASDPIVREEQGVYESREAIK